MTTVARHGTSLTSNLTLTEELDGLKSLKAVLLSRREGDNRTHLAAAAAEYVEALNAVCGKLLEGGADVDLAGKMLNEAEFITREEEGYFNPRETSREELRAAVYSNLAYLAKLNGCDDDAVIFLLEAAMLEGVPKPSTNVSLALLLLEMGRHDAAISSAQHAVATLQQQRSSGSISRQNLNVLACACHVLSLAQGGSVIPERRCEAARNLQRALLYASEVGDNSEIAHKVRSTIAYNNMANGEVVSTPESLPAIPQTTPPTRAFFHRHVIPVPKPTPPQDTFDPTATYPPTHRPRPPEEQREKMSKTMCLGRRNSFAQAATKPATPPEEPQPEKKARKGKRLHSPFADLDFKSDGRVEEGEVMAKLVNTRDLCQVYDLKLGVSTLGAAQMMHALNGASTDYGTWEGMRELKPVHCLLAVDSMGKMWVAAAVKTAQIRKNGLRVDTEAERVEVGDRLVFGKSHFRCIIRPPSPPVRPAAAPDVREVEKFDVEDVRILSNKYEPGEEWESLEASNIRSYIDILKREVEEEEAKLAASPRRTQPQPSTPPPPGTSITFLSTISEDTTFLAGVADLDFTEPQLQPPYTPLQHIADDTPGYPSLEAVCELGSSPWVEGIIDIMSRPAPLVEVSEGVPLKALTVVSEVGGGGMEWLDGVIDLAKEADGVCELMSDEESVMEGTYPQAGQLRALQHTAAVAGVESWVGVVVCTVFDDTELASPPSKDPNLTALCYIASTLPTTSWLSQLLPTATPTEEDTDTPKPLLIPSPRLDVRPTLIDILGDLPHADLPALSMLLLLTEPNKHEQAEMIQRAWRCAAARGKVRLLRSNRALGHAERDEAAAFIQYYVRSLREVRRAKKELRMRQELLRSKLNLQCDEEKASIGGR